MLLAARAEDFFADPIGRYCLGRRHCVFAASPTLLGFAAWGRPGVADIAELLRLCEIGVQPGSVPHRWLVDVRGLETVEPGTFALFVQYTRKHRMALGQNIVRQAQLRPEGLVGAIISGFSHVTNLPYPERVFADVGESLDWLEVERSEGVALVAELESIRHGSREKYAVVGRLRDELARSSTLSVASVALAARRLGLSTRGLQRALREAGTTYRMELQSFRVRRAQDLLRGGRGGLEGIAAELGFSTAQHFATAYRRATGVTPSEWRARSRADE